MTMSISFSKAEPELRDELHVKQSLKMPTTANPSFLEKSSKGGSQQLPILTIMSNAWLELAANKSKGFYSASEQQDELQSKSTESSHGSPYSYQSREEFKGEAPRRSQSSLASQVKSSIGWALRRHSYPSQASDSHQEQGPPPHIVVTTEASFEHLKPPAGSSRPINTRRDFSHVYDEEDEECLKQHYDRSTWDMYIRITEARKRANFQSTSVGDNFVPATEHNFETDRREEWDHSIESDHELIFGDLDF
jgi:hypothetical protein